MLWADILITENISANKTNLKKKKKNYLYLTSGSKQG